MVRLPDLRVFRRRYQRRVFPSAKPRAFALAYLCYVRRGFSGAPSGRDPARHLCGPFRSAPGIEYADFADGRRHSRARPHARLCHDRHCGADHRVIARLLQGLSVGGEFASATAMLIEYAPINKKIYYGAFQMCSQSFALMLAAGFVYVLSRFLDHNALVQWGWRLPFLLGALIGPIGFYIRRRVAESPEFVWLEEHRPRQRSPLAALARGHLSAVVFAIGLVVAGTAGVYLWDTYLPVYVLRTLQLPLSVSMRNVALIGLIGTVLNPLIGALADRVGAYRVFLPSLVIMGLLSYPLFAFIIGAPSAEHLLEVQLIAGLLRMGISAPIPGLMAVTFPTEARSTGMAIAYNISVAVFGGLAPFTVTGLMAATGSRFVPAYYLAAASLLTVVLVLAFRPARMPGLVAAETLSVPTR